MKINVITSVEGCPMKKIIILILVSGGMASAFAMDREVAIQERPQTPPRKRDIEEETPILKCFEYKVLMGFKSEIQELIRQLRYEQEPLTLAFVQQANSLKNRFLSKENLPENATDIIKLQRAHALIARDLTKLYEIIFDLLQQELNDLLQRVTAPGILTTHEWAQLVQTRLELRDIYDLLAQAIDQQQEPELYQRLRNTQHILQRIIQHLA